MQDKSIQRLRYRLKSIGCTDIHLKSWSNGLTVFATFYYGDKFICTHIPLRYVNHYPFVRYEFFI